MDQERPAAMSPARGTAPQPSKRLKDLLRLDEGEFVAAIFQELLGRDPSEDEADYHRDRLLDGRLSKTGLVLELAGTEAGRERAAKIEGLRSRQLAATLAAAPVLGPLATTLGSWARMPRLASHVRRVRYQTERLRREVERLPDELVERSERGLHALREEIVERQDRLAGQVERLGERLDRLDSRLAELNQRLAVLQRSVMASPRTLEPSAGVSAPELSTADATTADDAFYAAFEDCFRGTREEISRKQMVHLPLLEAQGPELAELPVIDLGCGRGEWLELLRRHAIEAVGVDRNRLFLAENAERGLDVVEADALAYLRGRPERSARAITGFHIIEHLPFDVLQALLDETLRVLADGGFALFETPNPENLITAAHRFYNDPTHRHPIPPEVAAFLLRTHGFREVELRRLHANQDPAREQIASSVLRDLLYGPQDYAVIGYR